jgi:hypothetical protein
MSSVPVLEYDDDDAAHVVTDAYNYRESYYCNFHDVDSDLHGVAWQGARPNMGLGEAIFLLYDGETKLIHSVDVEIPVAKDVGKERRNLGRQRFECLEPWNHWRLHFEDTDSDTKLTVDWQRLTKVCDWHPIGHNADGGRHLQAGGRTTVQGEVAGRKISFSGFGERDRGWGPRNYDPIDLVWFLTVQFPDGTCAHGGIESVDGVDRPRGYIHMDGETRDLVVFEGTDIDYSPSPGPASTAVQRLVDDLGRELVIATQKRWPDYLTFGTPTDGAQLVEGPQDPSKSNLFYLTFWDFTRADGMVGKGMMDFNMRRGAEPRSFAGAGGLASTLYDFGLTAASE